MPYITQGARSKLEPLDPQEIPGPGELNYLLSQIIDNYIVDCGISYTVFNDVVGVLECLKMELYRRAIASYEDKKLSMNGDVFSFMTTVFSSMETIKDD